MFINDLPRFLPYPTGNINGLMSPDCMTALKNSDSQWWFYVGLLTDDRDKDKHSFELSFITIENHNFHSAIAKKLVAVDFDFTFKDGDQSFHASSFTGPASSGSSFKPGDNPNFLGLLDVSTANDSFNLSVLPLFNDEHGTIAKITYNPADSSPNPFSLYAGYVGQPGACYDFNARGSTFLTCYNSNNDPTTVLYAYEVEFQLVDERGIVPEAWGGYSGVDLTKSTSNPNHNLSVEYAQPRLRVKSWHIKLTPYEPASGDVYNFSSNLGSDFLWLDRQALYPEPWAFKTTNLGATTGSIARINKSIGLSSIVDEAIEQVMNHDLIKTGGHTTNQIKKHLPATQGQLPQLYQGCWFGLTLTGGHYAGISAVFVAIWSQLYWQRPGNLGNYDTDYISEEGVKDAWGGFMNLYLGMLKRGDCYDPMSAYVLTDVLDMNNMPSDRYRIRFTEQITDISDIQDPQRWAKTIEITVKGHSQARYALAAYAKRGEREENPAIDQDVVFTLNIVSPHTITTVGSSIYEGAAEVKDSEGNVIGSAWVEQMVG